MGSLLALGTGASILFMIIKAVLILLIGYIVINLVTGAVKKSLEKNPKIDPMLHGFLVKVLRILLWVVVIVVAAALAYAASVFGLESAVYQVKISMQQKPYRSRSSALPASL